MTHRSHIKLLPLLVITISFIQITYAQVPVIEWHKAFGGRDGEYAHSIETTFDGGYIASGYTEGPDNGDIMGYHGNEIIGDLWVVKMDASGKMEWQKCLGGTFMEHAAFIRQTAEGGYIVAGTSASVDCNIKSKNSADFWIVKLNASGDIEWQKSYGGTKNEYVWALSLGSDGSYFVAGSSESGDGDVTGNKGNTDYWIIKLNSSGNLIWQKSMGGSGEDAANAVQHTPDGGCIVAGYTWSTNGDVTNNHGERDYWVVKLNNAGNIDWQKCYGGSGHDMASSIKAAIGGGYIIAGQAGSNDGDVSGNHAAPGADFWLVKIDQSGNILWQRCYGGSKNEIAYALDVTSDGGYIVVGDAESNDGDVSCNAYITDVWVIKVNSSGLLEWKKSMGGNYYDEAYAVKVVKPGEYIIAGATCSDDVTGRHPHQGGDGSCADFWVIKLTTPASAPAPEVTISPSSGNVCAASPATFTASVQNAGTHFTYRWERNGTTVGSDQATYTASDWNNNEQLICYVTSGGTCETTTQQMSNIVTIKVNNNTSTQSVNMTANSTSICDCEPVIFGATVTNDGLSPHFQWQVNGVNKDNNSNIFTSAAFQNGDEVKCVYSDNSTCIANGVVESNIIKLAAGTPQPATIYINTSDTIICDGVSVTFSASAQNVGNSPTYDWKINDVSTGTSSSTYTTATLKNNDKITCKITVDPLFKCTSSSTAISNTIKIKVNAKEAPLLNISASKTSICQNYPVTFTTIAENAGNNPSYQWMVNGISSGSNEDKFITSALNDKDEVSCIITIDPSNNCASASTATSNIIQIEVANVSAPAVSIQSSKSEICIGESIEFNSVATNAGTTPIYTWKVNDLIAGENTASFGTTLLKAGDKVSCEIISGDDGACAGITAISNILSPVIYDTLVISIHPSDTVILSGTQIQLTPLASANVLSYQWNPSNQLEDPSSYIPLTKNLTETQTYTITAWNEHHCKGSAKAIVKVFTELFMPNMFTPNNDGVNDIFRIPPNVILDLKEFSVYNRWGNKIFFSKSIDKGWDGNVNGSPAPTGTYIYLISGVNNHGAVSRKGTVTLIR